MKKNDTLPKKTLQPNQKTVEFLLHFSKGLVVMHVGNRPMVVSKN